jgi:hypothetical protein
MNEDHFWSIISLLDWSKTGNDEQVLEPAVQLLAMMTEEQIFGFEDKLAERLHDLDRKDVAKNIGIGAWSGPNQPFSPDEFLYARCCVVANGRQVYASVLADPTKTPKDCEFEALLTLARKAFERRTGQSWDYVSPIDYESFANVEGWQCRGDK